MRSCEFTGIGRGRSLLSFLEHLQKRRNDVHRQRKHDGGILVGGDHGQRLEVTQLDRLGLLRQHLRRLRELFRGLQLAVGMDHLGAALTLRFGLPRDRPHHGGIDVDVLDLHRGYLDAPGIGLRVEYALNVEIQLVALGEELVELMLAENGAQRRLRELARRLEEVRNLDDRPLRIYHPEIEHRVHFDGNVVARDDVLRRNVEHYDAQVDSDHLLNERNEHDEPRPLDHPEAPEHEDHGALVLAEYPQRGDDEYGDEYEQAAQAEIPDHHRSPLKPAIGDAWPARETTSCRGPPLGGHWSPGSGSTRRVSPSIPLTRTLCP